MKSGLKELESLSFQSFRNVSTYAAMKSGLKVWSSSKRARQKRRVSTYAAMKSGLKETTNNRQCASVFVSTYAAMKSGLKE